MFEVRVLPFEQSFECAEGESILDAALRQGLFLRYGCRNGGCGTCKARLADGDVDEPAAPMALSAEDRAEDNILLCSSSPVEDCAIDVGCMGLTEEEFLSGDQSGEYLTQVELNEPLTHDIRALRLRLIEPAEMSFVAGQFVNVQVPGSEEVRSYSMANCPSEAGCIELIVKILPGGAFSEALADRIQVGDKLRVFGPYGQLRVRLSHRSILMVAGGSGLAPLLSMLTRLTERGNERPVTLFFCARTPADLYYLERIEALGERMPLLEFVPALSDSWPSDWMGETGLATEAVARRMSSLKDFDAYLCGPPPMIEAAKPLLLERGVRPRNIYFDAFLPTGASVASSRSSRDG